jgi:hypothetical protein
MIPFVAGSSADLLPMEQPRSRAGHLRFYYGVAVPGPLSDANNDPWFTTLIAVGAALAGIVLWVLTTVVSHSHLSGSGWSLSGNGILIIPFGLGPALVAGGWTAIILRMRGHPRWLSLGILGGAVGVAFVGASLLSLIVFGPAHREIGSTAALFFGFLLYGWILAAAVIAGLIPAPDPDRSGPPLWSIAAIVLLPVTLVAGCQAGVGVLPY